MRSGWTFVAALGAVCAASAACMPGDEYQDPHPYRIFAEVVTAGGGLDVIDDHDASLVCGAWSGTCHSYPDAATAYATDTAGGSACAMWIGTCYDPDAVAADAADAPDVAEGVADWQGFGWSESQPCECELYELAGASGLSLRFTRAAVIAPGTVLTKNHAVAASFHGQEATGWVAISLTREVGRSDYYRSLAGGFELFAGGVQIRRGLFFEAEDGDAQ